MRLFAMLKEEIFISIYGPDVALAKDVDFMKSVPIFSVLSQMEAQVKDLREQSSALRAQLDDKEAEIASMMQMSGSVQATFDQEKKVWMNKLSLQETRYEEERKRAHIFERDLAEALDKLEQAKFDTQDEKDSYAKLKTATDFQLGIAHRLVAEAASREELLHAKSALKEKDALIKKLQDQLKTDRATMTPRPNLFRASEHVELRTNGLARKSRDVVDDLCDVLDFTSKRLDRMEKRLDRPFVALDVAHVDWFSLEPSQAGKNVECLFVSYCRPEKSRIPGWLDDDRRKTMLNACRLTARKFQKLLLEWDVNKDVPLEHCREMFKTSGSGKPVTDLSFVEFSNCFVRLAIRVYRDAHNTHEDIRGLLRKFSQKVGLDDTETFCAKLIRLERMRADDPPELTAANVTAKLKGLPADGKEPEAEALSAEAEMLRLLRAQHLEIMEKAALGYYRSAEYAAWLSAHPSPRVDLSLGKLYTRKVIKGGRWSEKPRGGIFDPPPRPRSSLDDYDHRCGMSPTAVVFRDRVFSVSAK